MNVSNKIKCSVFVTLAFLIFASNTFAQKADKSCFEVKYLDFFGLDKIDEINWSDKEISGLIETDYFKKFDETRFLIPFLVRSIATSV